MAHLAECRDDESHNARRLAEDTQLPAPVVSKILKSLTRAGLLISQRGSKGGYSLARTPDEIPVVEMITALEGPVGITECTIQPGACAQESNCQVRDPWQRINGAVHAALASEGVEVEVVVLDDHSTDETARIVQRLVNPRAARLLRRTERLRGADSANAADSAPLESASMPSAPVPA